MAGAGEPPEGGLAVTLEEEPGGVEEGVDVLGDDVLGVGGLLFPGRHVEEDEAAEEAVAFIGVLGRLAVVEDHRGGQLGSGHQEHEDAWLLDFLDILHAEEGVECAVGLGEAVDEGLRIASQTGVLDVSPGLGVRKGVDGGAEQVAVGGVVVGGVGLHRGREESILHDDHPRLQGEGDPIRLGT